MRTVDLIGYIENWAPPGAAWERDNIGLQVGSSKTDLKNVLLALEVNEAVVKEALKKKCNFILTHHPFIFNKLSRINTAGAKGKIIALLIKNDITLYSAHTNLDFTEGGVSFRLAEKLGLKNLRYLANEKGNQFKVAVFLPENDLEKVSNAIFQAGGGIIGNYSHCSYRAKGNGTFRGGQNSNPAIGEKEKFETVEEIKLEALVYSWKLNDVLSAVRKAHSYEEPAVDVYPLENENVNYGYGVVGELDPQENINAFLLKISKKLNTTALKYCKGKTAKIKTVAVCGGSGADLIPAAIGAGADAYVTADIKYHTFQDAENKIYLIDAGHYETEVVVLDEVKKRLEKFVKENNGKIEIYKFKGSTNPVKIFNLK
ncbi:MAG: Nif3-like dinuclear metal center hexameric protein [Chlorobi bacterium]|nr:Nif3-like dinuclear metal center hexameric protein [Chlorobiota bacterium]